MLHCEKAFRCRYAHFTYNESGLRCFTRWKVFNAIECFHSRGQHLWKFMGIKESVCIRKEFNSHRIGLGHQHGCRFIVLGHQYGRRDVMWKHSIHWIAQLVPRVILIRWRVIYPVKSTGPELKNTWESRTSLTSPTQNRCRQEQRGWAIKQQKNPAGVWKGFAWVSKHF